MDWIKARVWLVDEPIHAQSNIEFYFNNLTLFLKKNILIWNNIVLIILKNMLNNTILVELFQQNKKNQTV